MGVHRVYKHVIVGQGSHLSFVCVWGVAGCPLVSEARGECGLPEALYEATLIGPRLNFCAAKSLCE